MVIVKQMNSEAKQQENTKSPFFIFAKSSKMRSMSFEMIPECFCKKGIFLNERLV